MKGLSDNFADKSKTIRDEWPLYTAATSLDTCSHSRLLSETIFDFRIDILQRVQMVANR